MNPKILFTLFAISYCFSSSAEGTWTQKADFGGVSRRIACSFSIGNKGYIGIGRTGSFYKDFWEFEPSTNVWTQKADFGGTAPGIYNIQIQSQNKISNQKITIK